jgi:LuxR family transcriptional regulator, maltose regulon positive regulatory protein
LEGRISESAACLDYLDRIAQDHPAPKSCAWSDIHRYSALARAHLALSQNRAQSAISILKKLQQEAHAAHAYYFALRVGAHLATACLRSGDRAGALVALRKVLNVGVEVGLYQTILYQGPEIGPLLLAFGKTGRAPETLQISCPTSIASSRAIVGAISLK